MSETTTRPSAASIAEAAERLDSAARTGHPVPPVRELIGSTDLDAAYSVQQELVRRRRSAGAVVVGRKIGLTSPAVQRQLGVDRPDFGVLFADMDVSEEAEVASARLMQPKIEAEIAFVLGRDLTEAPSAEDARRSVDHAVAALEIVDSRITEWNISITDTIADNASSGLFVLGEHRLRLDEFEPREVGMVLRASDETVSEGSGAACLGDPINALVWLARTAVEFGDPLRAGDIVLSGALGPMVPAPPGSRFRAEIGPFAPLTVAFSEERSS